jgi:hypothetical protein
LSAVLLESSRVGVTSSLSNPAHQGGVLHSAGGSLPWHLRKKQRAKRARRSRTAAQVCCYSYRSLPSSLRPKAGLLGTIPLIIHSEDGQLSVGGNEPVLTPGGFSSKKSAEHKLCAGFGLRLQKGVGASLE